MLNHNIRNNRNIQASILYVNVGERRKVEELERPYA